MYIIIGRVVSLNTQQFFSPRSTAFCTRVGMKWGLEQLSRRKSSW